MINLTLDPGNPLITQEPSKHSLKVVDDHYYQAQGVEAFEPIEPPSWFVGLVCLTTLTFSLGTVILFAVFVVMPVLIKWLLWMAGR